MTKTCPLCKTDKGVREYLYGMPSEEPDTSKFILGGCCISDEMPDYRCLACGTDFFKKGDEFRNRFISDGTGISFKCQKCQEWIPVLDGKDSHTCKTQASPWENY
jgi:hypothetical protein